MGGKHRGTEDVSDISDISERKDEEQALRESVRFFQQLFDAIQDGVSLLDPELRIVRVNQWMQKMYAHRGRIAGRKCYEIYQQRESPCPFCPILPTLETGEPHTEVVPYPSEKDPTGWLELTGFPVKDADGTVRHVIEWVKDITERTRLEQQLRHSEKMQAIGQLAGGIAHDFNNQLAGIVGCVDLLREDLPCDSAQHELIDSILTAAGRARDLTAQLLAFARKGRYRSVAVDVHEIIREVISLLERSIDKRIAIRLHLDASPSTTRGDPSQIQNAMLNLALNARDAMPAGGELTFATEAVELDEEHCRRFSDDLPVGRYLQICVTDTGVGMDGETAKHVFEPFFTTKGAGGTGMGLAAVYGTVRSHQGAIDVRTELGQGTTFCICLPLASTQERGDDSRGPADEVARAEVHVLLVDDEPVVRDALGKLLRRLGYRVTCCDNGAEGLEIYRKSWETIALVILDMVMPVMSGRETFAAMLEVNPDIVAVLSSGYSVDGEAEEILAMGVKAFIQKPFGLADLSRQLSAILGDAAPRTLG